MRVLGVLNWSMDIGLLQWQDKHVNISNQVAWWSYFAHKTGVLETATTAIEVQHKHSLSL